MRDADNPGGNPVPGVAGGLAAVVRFGMDDYGAPQNVMLPVAERDVVNGDRFRGDTLRVGFEIPQVSCVPLFLFGESVFVALRIEMPAGAGTPTAMKAAS